MATKKPAKAKTTTKKPAAKGAATKRKAVAQSRPQTAAVGRPVKQAFTKAGLAAHLADMSQVELKSVKLVLTALEATVLGSLNKKGLGTFTLPGLLKVAAVKVPAKKRRFAKNPFTGEEQWFAAKPATTRVKIRPLKKLKDAAL